MNANNLKHILHIDDDVDDHEIFYEALQQVNDRINYRALTDARDALTRLRAKEVKADVIFIDLNMPEMNGQQFLVEIKNCNELKHIPVVVLSTASYAGTIEATKELGAKHFITKPNSFNELVAALSSVLLF
jgi:CheY-like chemotaxis protein